MAWLDPWGIRQRVKVTNNTGRYLYNYQILIELTSSNFDFENCKSDGSDIRFTEPDGITELPYWIEKWNSENKHARIWVRTFLLPPSESFLFLYYNNPDVEENKSDGESTFKFFDDFTGTSLNTEKWDEDVVNDISHEINDCFRFKDCTKSSGAFWIYDNSDTGSQHQAKWTPIDSFVLEFQSKISDTASSQMGQGSVALVGSDNKISAHIGHADGNGYAVDPLVCTVFIEGVTGGSLSVDDGDERDFKYVVNGTNVKIYQKATDEEEWTLMIEGTSNDIAKIALVAGGYGGYPYLDYIEIKNVRIRKYAEPEPVAELGEVNIKRWRVNFQFGINALFDGRQGGKILSLFSEEAIDSSLGCAFSSSTETLMDIDPELESTFNFSPLPLPPNPYTYRFPIFIENNTGSSLFDFQIPIDITVSNFDYACCNEYGSDINFFTEDYSQELPFWWEEWNYNGNSKVWIKVPEIPPGFHLCAILVCGHSEWEYVRPEQPKEVFLFYDGFERSDVSSWTFEFSPSDSGEPYYGVADACHGDYELKAGYSQICDNPYVTVKQTISLPSGEKVLNCWQKETNTHVYPTHAIYVNGVEKWSDVVDSEYEDCVFVQTSSFTDSGSVEIKFTDSKDTSTNIGIRLDSIFVRKYVEPFPTATLLGKDSSIFRVYRDFQLDCLFPLEDFKKNDTIMISGRLESFPLSELSVSCSQNDTLPVSSYIPAFLKSNNFLLIPGSWKRKRNVTIENNTGQTLTDYQICLTLTPENFDYENCRLDGGDLRFTNPSLALLPYWIEKWEYNGTSRIWVKVDEIPTGSNVCLSMFYDNPLATSESDARETLEFYDDFSSSDEWSFSNDELMYVSDGLFKFEYSWSDDARAYVKNFFTLPDSFYVQFKIKIQDVLQNISSFFVGFQDAIENEANCVGFFPNREEDSYDLYVKDGGEVYQCSMYSTGGSQDIQTEMFYDDMWYGIRIWKSGNVIHGEVWDEEFNTKLGEGEILDHNPSQMDELVVFNEKYLGIKGHLDDLFITKYASPALTVIIGDPQYSIISDVLCCPEEIVDLKLNSTYLIGSHFNLLTELYSTFILHYVDEFSILPEIEFSAVPLLESLFNVSAVIGETSIQKKFWIWESLLQSVDVSSLFFINSNSSLNLESELMGAPYTHWLINEGNVPNLISYKVTQEWAAPDTAEVRFKGLPQFLAGDYVHIVYDTGNADYPQVTLFNGPVLTIDRELVKGREETTVRAVSNEWYLTKQNCFWDEESSLYTLDPALSLRDILLMWFGSWCKDLCCDPSHIPNTFSTVCEKWREKHGSCWSSISSEDEWWSWFNYHLGKYWKNTTGIMPFYFENIPDWKDKYVINAGKSGFNFFYGTTKWDAIMQICNVCDCVFYCLYWDDNHPIVDPWEGVQVDRGRRLALLLTRETSEDTELIEILGHPISGDDFFYSGNPLARDLALKVNNRSEDGNLISKLISVKTREEQSSEETKINRLAVTCQDFPVITTEERGTGIKPVEEYIAISNIDVDELEDLQQFAEGRLEELRTPNVTFEARFLDLTLTEKKIEYYGGETRIPIHTGMYIGFDGIDGLPPSSDKDGYYRIMKITYELGEQTGGKLITTLECRDTDLIHPGSPKLNEIENIMHREAKKIEKGPILPGHPCPSNPRPPMLGEIPWIEIGEVVGYDPEQQTVDVKIRKTGQIVKGVPLL